MERPAPAPITTASQSCILHLLPGHRVQLLVAVLRENVAVLAPLVAFIRDMPLERKILFHGILLVVVGRISESATAVAPSEIRPKVFLGRISYTLLLVAGATGRTAGSGLLGGLLGSTAGRTAGGGLLGGLVGSAAGRTAGGGLLSGLVGSTASRTAGGGLLSGLVGSTASRSRGGSRLLVPAKEIRKSHRCLPPNTIQWAFRPPVSLLYLKHISDTSTHNFVT